MRDFPRRLATGEDIENCYAMVKNGTFDAAELLEAMIDLENQNYIVCPIREVSDTRRVVTVGYCAEAKVDDAAMVGGKTVKINAVKHTEGESDIGEAPQYETTEIAISAKAPDDVDSISIQAPYNIYDAMGITKARFDSITADLTA